MKIQPLKSSFKELNEILFYSYLPKIINTAIEVNLFEILGNKSKNIDEISSELNTNPIITKALLEVLTSINLISEINSEYALTKQSEEFLLSTSDVNQINEVKKYSGSKGGFDNLSEALRSEVFDFDNKMWASKEVMLDMYQSSKVGLLQNAVEFISNLKEFENCKKMCDLAGNFGYYSLALIEKNQQLYSEICELPKVCQISKEIIKNEKHKENISFREFDIDKNQDLGNEYDLFLSSNCLYEKAAKDGLTDFFKQVNRSMKKGGIFVSNHFENSQENKKLLSIINLMTVSIGYPTHILPQSILEKSLTDAGFGDFYFKFINKETPYPVLLFSAKKIHCSK